MKPVTIDKVTVSDGNSSARFDPLDWSTVDFPMGSDEGSFRPARAPRSLMTQIHMSRPYAALGATFKPGSDRLIVRVGHTGPWAPEGRAPEGLLRAERSIVGLPYELSLGALAGLVDIAKSVHLGPGELTVNMAAYDPIESSVMSFKIAGGIMMWAIAQNEAELDSNRLNAFWNKWSSNSFAWT